MEDFQLIEEYAARNSQSAFQSLVDRYVKLVHSTALREVGSAAMAEDVAQAVFILLAKKAAGLAKTKNLVLSGWLYRTTRFVAARAARGEMRRQRREEEALRMQQISAPDETWRRLAPLLDEGIEQLQPAERDALILRFLQDEPLQGVGAALGITEEAARKRVSRSLDKLRGFFVRRGFSLSAAALAAALAGATAEAAPAGLAASLGPKALASLSAAAPLPALVAETLSAWRWAKLKLAGLCGVGAVAAISLLLLAARAGTPPAPPVSAPAAQSSPAPAPSAAAGAAVAAAPSAPKSGWHFSLQTVDAENGKPIAHARVLVESVGEMRQIVASPQQIDRQTNLLTDAEGRCQITLPYAQPLMVSVGVLADGYAVRSVVGGGPKPLPASYVMKVPRGTHVGGVVVDESGKPVSGAAIHLAFYGTGDASNREFQQDRPGLLNEDPLASTDAAGRWTFGSCSSNGDFSISVGHAAFPTARFHNDDDPHTATDQTSIKMAELRAGTARLVLKAGLNLRGTVTDEAGAPISGAKIKSGKFASQSRVATAADDGSFTLPALSDGEETITVTADHFAPQRLQVRMSSNTAPLTVQLKPGALLRLRIVDDTGMPVPEARVGLERWEGYNTLDWSGLTDADGRLDWDSAPLEPMGFSILKEGYFASRNNTITADSQEHEIKLRRQVKVVGRVIDAATRQPVPAFKVAPDPDRNETVYGTNGSFEITFKEFSNPLLLRVEAAGYETLVSPALNPVESNQSFTFELKADDAAAAIQGTVLLPDGSAQAGVEVALSGVKTSETGGEDGDGRSDIESWKKTVEMGKARFVDADPAISTRTDASGHFSLKPSATARAIVAVHASGFVSAPIPAAGEPVSLQLQPWGRIEGQLKLSTQPVSGQSITLSGALGLARDSEATVRLSLGAYTVKTDKDGKFVFQQAPPGNFDLYIANLGAAYHHKTPVQIQPGVTVTVQIGGTGAIVSGQLALSKPGPAVDWSRQLRFAGLRTRIPYPPGLSGPAMAEWFKQYRQTEEGKRRLRETRNYPMVVQPDGTFTVEDIPAGDYEMGGELYDIAIDPSRDMGDASKHRIGAVHQRVTVPQPAGAQTVEKIDVGTVTVQLFKK
jgi:RNA polymerase sigma factor (sigma-70 family)